MEEKKSSGKRIKEKLKLEVIAIIGLIVMQCWGYFSEFITAGAEVKFQQQVEAVYQNIAFKNKVDSLFQANMQDPSVLRMILASEAVGEFAQGNAIKVEQAIVDRVLSEDSSKISTVGYLGQATGLRDEVILPLLAKILKAYEEGEIMTKDQVESLLTRRIRGTF